MQNIGRMEVFKFLLSWLMSNVVQNHTEDQTEISLEEASHAYRKLEHDYQEFLSQCGMSKWGYWRGGSQR